MTLFCSLSLCTTSGKNSLEIESMMRYAPFLELLLVIAASNDLNHSGALDLAGYTEMWPLMSWGAFLCRL